MSQQGLTSVASRDKTCSTFQATNRHQPGQHSVPPVVVKQAKTVTGPKRDEVPLGVQRHGRDGGRRQALHQHQGLEPRSEGGGLEARLQPVVSLPGEALPVLQQVHHRHVHRVVRALVAQAQNDHLEAHGRGWRGGEGNKKNRIIRCKVGEMIK